MLSTAQLHALKAAMHGASGKVSFSANVGDIMDLRVDQAERWVRRACAGLASTTLYIDPQIRGLS